MLRIRYLGFLNVDMNEVFSQVLYSIVLSLVFFFFFLRTNKNPTEVTPCPSRCTVSEMMSKRSEAVVRLSGVFIYSSCFCVSLLCMDYLK